MNEPLVSVIVPVYNGEKYIDECIWSIFNQTYKNLEVVVINDCSTDNTKNLLEELKNNKPEHIQFNLINLEQNKIQNI